MFIQLIYIPWYRIDYYLTSSEHPLPPPFSVPQGMETSIKTVIIHELINMFNTERGRHGCVRKMVVCTCACRSNYEIGGILNGMVNNGPPTSTKRTTTCNLKLPVTYVTVYLLFHLCKQFTLVNLSSCC